MIAKVYCWLGRAESALYYAERCFELTEQHADLMADFDKAYAYEILGRANALSGNFDVAQAQLQTAEQLGNAIQDEEDRSIFMGDVAAGNWYGVRGM